MFKFKSGEKEGTARADNDRKEFLSKFDCIRYVEKNDNREEMFAFTFDYDNFAMHNTVIAKKNGRHILSEAEYRRYMKMDGIQVAHVR